MNLDSMSTAYVVLGFVLTFCLCVASKAPTTSASLSSVASKSPTTSASSSDASSVREVCELNSSCSTPSSENKAPKKWQYNVSDSKADNETTNVIHSVHESNDSSNTLSFEIDVAKNNLQNRSTSSNESKPVVIKYPIQLEENCFCDTTVNISESHFPRIPLV